MKGPGEVEAYDGLQQGAAEVTPVWKPMPQRTLRCYKCGYEWVTKAKLKYVTCPSCHYKIDSEKCLVIRTG